MPLKGGGANKGKLRQQKKRYINKERRCQKKEDVSIKGDGANIGKLSQ